MPTAVVGHSNGEFVALQAAGAFRPASDQQLIESIVIGAELAARVAKTGLLPDIELTAVEGVDPEAIAEVVRESAGKMVVAIDNCPHQVVLAGDPDCLAQAKEAPPWQGGLYQRLAIRALHTEGFLHACQVTEEIFRRMRFELPRIEVWSCTNASPYPTERAAVEELTVRQLRCKVRFRETIEAMYEAGVRLFVEIGPRGILSGFVTDTLMKRPHAAVPARRDVVAASCNSRGRAAGRAQRARQPDSPVQACAGPGFSTSKPIPRNRQFAIRSSISRRRS